jgi:dCTP deaminase
MTFWSGEKLALTPSVVDPFDKDQIDCNAYNLRMGGAYYRTGERETGYEQKKTILTGGEAFLIPAGQFAFLLSKETVRIPVGSMAFISMRTGIKFQGLINVSGFHVDPGYEGKLIFAVYNASPSSIQICQGDQLFKIWFCDMSQQSASRYLFDGRGLSDIGGDMIKGMNKEIYSLQSLAEKIRDQEAAINAKFAEQKPVIDNLTFVWRAAVLGVIGGLIITFLTFAFPSVLKIGDTFAEYWSRHVNQAQSPPNAKGETVLPPANPSGPPSNANDEKPK